MGKPKPEQFFATAVCTLVLHHQVDHDGKHAQNLSIFAYVMYVEIISVSVTCIYIHTIGCIVYNFAYDNSNSTQRFRAAV
jgi:hypothetical protein